MIWNLVPANPSFNSKKSNKVPELNQYFDVQLKTYKIVVHANTQNRFFEDYLTIFPDLDFHRFEEPNYVAFRNVLSFLVAIARDDGFGGYSD